MGVPVVTMNKGMFPDKPPFVTTRSPCSAAYVDGSLIITSYEWVNTVTKETGFVPGNASFVTADGAPVILLKGIVTTHIAGNGPVTGD